jgi:hypothetical protein
VLDGHALQNDNYIFFHIAFLQYKKCYDIEENWPGSFGGGACAGDNTDVPIKGTRELVSSRIPSRQKTGKTFAF